MVSSGGCGRWGCAVDSPNCRACNGTGRRVMVGYESQAIAMLTAAPGPVSTVEIRQRLWPRVKAPAACGRLARMEIDGLITSTRDPDNHRLKLWTVRHG